MATLAELADQVAAALEALVPAPARLASDYRTDLAQIPAGTTRYQLQVAAAGEDPAPRSNVVRKAASVTVRLHHYLADPADERAYTNGALHTYLGAVTDPDWWRAAPAVYRLIELPSVDLDRIGNVVSADVDLRVSVVPS